MIYIIGELGIDGVRTPYVKIGLSKYDARQRLEQLQIANPRKLIVVATCAGDRTSELLLHARFSVSRVRDSEWFRVERGSDLERWIAQCIASPQEAAPVKPAPEPSRSPAYRHPSAWLWRGRLRPT